MSGFKQVVRFAAATTAIALIAASGPLGAQEKVKIGLAVPNFVVEGVDSLAHRSHSFDLGRPGRLGLHPGDRLRNAVALRLERLDLRQPRPAPRVELGGAGDRRLSTTPG